MADKENKRILLVEDEESLAQTIKLNLEIAGQYEVQILLNAKDILSVVNKFRPDIILLDLLLPEIGGIEVCQMLNKDVVGRGIPIIVLSALDKDADIRKAYKLGVVDYFIKPIDMQKLVVSIEKHIKYKKSEET
ncbi:MAG: response regulator [Candidatus Omnitrophota bacterium]|nr:MAG: response regulator [Candidatus Omnitrophota bacterium]